MSNMAQRLSHNFEPRVLRHLRNRINRPSKYRRVAQRKQVTLTWGSRDPLRISSGGQKALEADREANKTGVETRHFYQHVRRHHATKIFLFFKTLKIQIFGGARFWVPLWAPGLFLKVFCALTTVLYHDITNTLPASFFTIMPKG